MEIPETRQASALERVARLGQARAETQAELDRLTAELREEAVTAARLGAARGRIKDLAQVSSSTFYAWLEAAGLEIRPKRPAARKTAKPKAKHRA